MDKKLQKLISQAKKVFRKEFPKSRLEEISYSPASIILLGDHTHYNDGVLILANLNAFSVACAAKNKNNSINVSVKSPDFEARENQEDQSEIFLKCGNLYIGSLISVLKEKGLINHGFDLLLYSDIPQSVGMGFVASSQISFVSVLNKIFNLGLSLEDISKICIESEKRYLGIMVNPSHYYAIINGKKGFLTKVDLRYSSFDLIPVFGNNYQFVIFTNEVEIPNPSEICVKRIEECQVGVKALRLYIWGIKNLRDVSLDFLTRHVHIIPKIIYKRILFTVSEKIRSESAVEKLSANDLTGFGELMFDSHNGLRNDYEIGSERLDKIVEYCKSTKQFLGAKLISCSSYESVVSFIKTRDSVNYIEKIKSTYLNEQKQQLVVYKFNLYDGCKILNLSHK